MDMARWTIQEHLKWAELVKLGGMGHQEIAEAVGTKTEADVIARTKSFAYSHWTKSFPHDQELIEKLTYFNKKDFYWTDTEKDQWKLLVKQGLDDQQIADTMRTKTKAQSYSRRNTFRFKYQRAKAEPEDLDFAQALGEGSWMRASWTEEEFQKFVSLVKQGWDNQQIAEALVTKSENDCLLKCLWVIKKHRWRSQQHRGTKNFKPDQELLEILESRNLFKIYYDRRKERLIKEEHPSVMKKKDKKHNRLWLDEERDLFRQLLEEGKDFKTISQIIGTKSERTCEKQAKRDQQERELKSQRQLVAKLKLKSQAETYSKQQAWSKKEHLIWAEMLKKGKSLKKIAKKIGTKNEKQCFSRKTFIQKIW